MKTSSGEIPDRHTWAIKLPVYLSNCSKHLDVLFLPCLYDGKEKRGKKKKSDLLEVNLAENIFKLEKLTLLFVLGHKHV